MSSNRKILPFENILQKTSSRITRKRRPDKSVAIGPSFPVASLSSSLSFGESKNLQSSTANSTSSSSSSSDNRLLVLCTSINDVTAWPFWKLLQMKKIGMERGAGAAGRPVTDLAMLAFNTNGGSFIARIEGKKYSFKNLPKVKRYNKDIFQDFLEEYYLPGQIKKNQYFIYGGHGMGDYLEFEQHKTACQIHELADIFNSPRTSAASPSPYFFDAILFDACFMSNLDCAHYLKQNTNYIVASEGYMWEPDTALDYHIFNTHTASLLSAIPHGDTEKTLETLIKIQDHYCANAARGDLSILSPKRASELREFVSRRVIPKIYAGANFYTAAQQASLLRIAASNSDKADSMFGAAGGIEGSSMMSKVGNMKLVQHNREEAEEDGHHSSGHSAPAGLDNTDSATASKTALLNLNILLPATQEADQNKLSLKDRGNKSRLLHAIQFEHALYPSEVEDKHLVDLKSHLLSIAATEKKAAAAEDAGREAQARAASESRVAVVEEQGTLPSLPEAPAAGDGDAMFKRLTSQASGDYRRSAYYGLWLFDQVVLRHVKPRAAFIYGAHLHGLSVSIHEYSSMSKPKEPWGVIVEAKPVDNGVEKEKEKETVKSRTQYTKAFREAKKALHKRAKKFLEMGYSPTVRDSNPEVSSTLYPAAPVAPLENDAQNTSKFVHIAPRPKRHLFKRMRSPF